MIAVMLYEKIKVGEILKIGYNIRTDTYCAYQVWEGEIGLAIESLYSLPDGCISAAAATQYGSKELLVRIEVIVGNIAICNIIGERYIDKFSYNARHGRSRHYNSV